MNIKTPRSREEKGKMPADNAAFFFALFLGQPLLFWFLRYKKRNKGGRNSEQTIK